ncbi:MAG: hypothetical protein ACKOEZ_04325, partial [Spartobacteria bacterium]
AAIRAASAALSTWEAWQGTKPIHATPTKASQRGEGSLLECRELKGVFIGISMISDLLEIKLACLRHGTRLTR